jgi:ankyrin repeat protein
MQFDTYTFFGESLCQAASDADAGQIKLNLAYGADLFYRNAEGKTPLHFLFASQHYKQENLESLLGLVQRSIQQLGLHDHKNNTLLHAACAAKNALGIFYLLKLRQSPNALNAYGESPLGLACTRLAQPPPANREMLEVAILALLACKGIFDTRTPSLHNRTILHHAAAAQEVRLTMILLGMDNPETTQLFQGRKADPLLVDDYKRSPLHLACQTGNVPIVQALLPLSRRSGQDLFGETPLHMAVRAGHEQVVATLLRFGVDRSIRDKMGKTALDYAKTASMKALF